MKATTTDAERSTRPAPADRKRPAEAPGAWARKRAWLLDLLLALGIFAYNLPTMPSSAPYLIGDPGSYAVLALLSLALCAVCLLRRRRPITVLVVLLALACAQQLLDAPIIMADVVLLFAVYAVAARHPWAVSLPAALAVIGWLLFAVVPRLGDDFLDVGQLGVLVLVTVWVWTWGTLVRIRRGYIAALRERAEHLEREREAQTRAAVAEERTRIAREIHDIVSHGLSAVVVLAEGAAATAEADPGRAKAAMLTVRDTGRTALAEMRRMLGVLREDEPGPRAPHPGIGDLEQLVGRSRAAGLPAVLTVEGTPEGVPDGVGLTVYRIVQESLTNVRRHAPAARRVEVRLWCDVAEVRLRITDDGAGEGTPASPCVPTPANSRPQASSDGRGIAGMRERAAAHGGTLSAGPLAGGGFEVSATLPTGGTP